MTERVGRRGLERLRGELGERDLAVVGSVADHRFMTARQIEGFHFVEHASEESGARICRRVLERLTEQRLLTRLERRIGGVRAGSASYIYTLGSVGDRLVRGEKPRRRRFSEPSLTFLDHTLAIGGTHLELLGASRARRFELQEVVTEPRCWRRFTGGGGGSEILRPDLFAVTASGETEHCWFLEIDLATESLPTVIRKCQQYAAYFRSGIEQERLGVFPYVVWIFPPGRRQERFERALSSASSLPKELFRATTPDGLLGLIAGGAQ